MEGGIVALFNFFRRGYNDFEEFFSDIKENDSICANLSTLDLGGGKHLFRANFSAWNRKDSKARSYCQNFSDHNQCFWFAFLSLLRIYHKYPNVKISAESYGGYKYTQNKILQLVAVG